MSVEGNKAVVGRWFTEFWGENLNPGVIDELADPDTGFSYSLHASCRGRDEVQRVRHEGSRGLSEPQLLGGRGAGR